MSILDMRRYFLLNIVDGQAPKNWKTKQQCVFDPNYRIPNTLLFSNWNYFAAIIQNFKVIVNNGERAGNVMNHTFIRNLPRTADE